MCPNSNSRGGDGVMGGLGVGGGGDWEGKGGGEMHDILFYHMTILLTLI